MPSARRRKSGTSRGDGPQQRGLVTTWVAPRAFADHFPNVTPDRLDKELGGIRGVLLDAGQVGALADRLQALLGPQSSANMQLE